MWPWEPRPQTAKFLENDLYQGPYLFAALYRFYKAAFWGAGIHIGPNRPIYPKGFLTSFTNLPIHLQQKILEGVWNDGKGFNEIIIKRGYPRLRVDLRFLFLIYSSYKAETFPINKFGFGCWNGGLYTTTEARFDYGPFNPCTSVNIPDFSDSFLRNKDCVNFEKLCLNGRKVVKRRQNAR